MESTGTTYKLVEISINQDFVDEINAMNKSSYTLEELQGATDKCLAHEWLKCSYLGVDKYAHLQITSKGIGAARSKQKADELKLSRSFLKKTSDYIVDHQGLFVILGFLIALATFSLKIFGDS